MWGGRWRIYSVGLEKGGGIGMEGEDGRGVSEGWSWWSWVLNDVVVVLVLSGLGRPPPVMRSSNCVVATQKAKGRDGWLAQRGVSVSTVRSS